MQEMSEHDRPREKIMRKGASCLTNQELIAAILGSGGPGRDVRDLSREIASCIRENPGYYRVPGPCRNPGDGSGKKHPR